MKKEIKDLEDKNGHLINREGQLVFDAKCSFCVDEMHEENVRRQNHKLRSTNTLKEE